MSEILNLRYIYIYLCPNLHFIELEGHILYYVKFLYKTACVSTHITNKHVEYNVRIYALVGVGKSDI
jgi:hypothetical protein